MWPQNNSTEWKCSWLSGTCVLLCFISLYWLTTVWLACLTHPRVFVFQHRQGVKGGVTGAGHPRHGRRGDRFLPRLGHLRAMSTCRGASVGGGRRAQRHRALRPIPRETEAVHHLRAGYLLKRRRGRLVGFTFTQGWGRHQYLHLLKKNWTPPSRYSGARPFNPCGEMHFNDF